MEYRDTQKDAVRAACEHIEGFDPKHDVRAVPDPSVEYCWLVLDFDSHAAAIIWLDDIVCGMPNFTVADEDNWDKACEWFVKKGGELPGGYEDANR